MVNITIRIVALAAILFVFYWCFAFCLEDLLSFFFVDFDEDLLSFFLSVFLSTFL